VNISEEGKRRSASGTSKGRGNKEEMMGDPTTIRVIKLNPSVNYAIIGLGRSPTLCSP
jgi:hypothetical protein